MTASGKAKHTLLLSIVTLLWLAFATPAQAEVNWPSSIYGDIQDGDISPIMLFSLVQDLFNKCAKEIESHVPGQLDPYIVAKKAFEAGDCRVAECFNFGMMLSILPMLSNGVPSGYQSTTTASGAGGAAQPPLNPQAAAAFAQGYSKTNEVCQNNGMYKPLPNLLPYFLSMNGGG